MTDMKTAFHVAVTDGDSVFPVGAIEHEGAIYLVPKWLVNDHEGWRVPAHLVSLDQRQLRANPEHPNFPRFSLSTILPKAVLSALTEGRKIDGWPVLPAPEVRYRIPHEAMM